MKIKKFWKNFKKQEHPIRFLVGIVLMKLRLSSFFVIKHENFELRFYPSSISLTRWLNPFCSSSTESFFRRYLRTGDVVIDAGANIGCVTLLSSVLVGNSGKIYAIEAHPRTYKYLQGNLALNKCENVLTYNIALGSSCGTVNFSDKSSDDQNVILQDSGIEIEMLRLDELFILDESIALLKIDVEGYEKFVLNGAHDTLQKVKCIIFESWDEHFENFDYTFGDVFDILKEEGFFIFKIDDEDLILLSKDYRSSQCEDLLAVREMSEFIERTGFHFKNIT